MSGLRLEPRVSVLYGRGIRSGGPEALHQLVDGLRGHGVDAHLVAHHRTAASPRVPDYEGYDAPEAPMPPDRASEVVIAPEVYLPELLALRRARRFCWWLSIDNSPAFRAERYLADLRGGLADPPRPREVRSVSWWVAREVGRWRARLVEMEHLAQSDYAAAYLSRRLGVDALSVTDYLSGTDELLALHARRTTGAEVRIAFNPAKGARLVARVRRRVDVDAVWVPIVGMSPSQAREALGRATVYLDLGPHPGKDRIPREAALAGAVVAVARRGSASNDRDVPLPPAYKIDVRRDPVAHTEVVLRRILEQTERAASEQQAYREGVLRQPEVFAAEVRRLADALRGQGGPAGTGP